MTRLKDALKGLGPVLMPLAVLLIVVLCTGIASAQETAGNTAAGNATASQPAAPSFLDTLETTWAAWRTWLRSLSPYAVAGVGGLFSYVTGFLVFLAAFSMGSYAPVAARTGLWVFALIWFVLMAAVFIPATAPWWWWLVGFAVLAILLAMVPKPRATAA